MLLNILQCPLQCPSCAPLTVRVVYFPQCLWWMLVSMVQSGIHQGVRPAPTNCWPPGKGLMGAIVQQEHRGRALGFRSISGMGLPVKRPKYARAICASGAAFQKMCSLNSAQLLISSLASTNISDISLLWVL